MKTNRHTIATLLVGCGIAASATAQSITSTGVVGGGNRADVLAMSADGTAVTGYCSLTAGGFVAFRWTASGGIQNLGVVPGGLRSLGFAISGDGGVVTGMSVVSGAGHVFRWTPANGMQDLGTIPLQNVSYGYAISADGLVIGGGPSSAGFGHALTWDNDAGMVDRGALPGAPADAPSTLYGLDADGDMGTGSSGTLEGERAILWSADTNLMESLGVLEGGASSEGTAISAEGAVVAGTSDSASGMRAFRWTRAAGMQDLGVVPGRSSSHATAMSADGSVVVGFDDFGPIMWTSSLGMVDLEPYLAAHGVNLTGWNLINCYGISADRTALAGMGLFNGQQRGWVVRGLEPITTPCPADLSGSSDPSDPAYGEPDGVLDSSDFFYYLDQFVAGNLAVADLSGSSDPNDPGYGVPDGTIDAADFFTYLDQFAAGCE